ncbi:MAG: TIGR03435 family protein [Acidobacteriia bacterium]|nr:TIGR03435 family protein [Terriglobia bacterium]
MHRRILLALAPVWLLCAQGSPAPEFEVASIRPSGAIPQGQAAMGVHIDGAQVRIAYFTLKDYLGIAYRTKISQISGPDWIGSDRFDIAATLPEGAKPGQVPEMLQVLLTDRFQVKTHHDKREFPVYAMVLGKGPLKLKEVPPDDNKDKAPEPINATGGGSAAGVSVNLGNGSSWTFVPNRFEAKKLSMRVFAGNLERFADRPIIDMTGLKGEYDFAFDVDPEDYRPMLIRSAVAAGVNLPPEALRYLDGSSSASLSAALERIGLRLEPRKAPLEVIVVDGATRTPSAN